MGTMKMQTNLFLTNCLPSYVRLLATKCLLGLASDPAIRNILGTLFIFISRMNL